MNDRRSTDIDRLRPACIESSFLQLMRDGADPTELARLRDDKLAAAADDPGHAKKINEAFELAVELTAELTGAKRQAAARQALLLSARQLGELPTDTDTVLSGIVDRARRLLGCDFTYLSLNDNSTQETYFRVASGALTTRWQTLRIPYGVGVGGRVAAAAAPFVTADYLNDSRLQHSVEADLSVSGEKQAAIAGVPLVHHGRVIGVLFASNRTPGALSQQTVELLTDFATLAAAAIDRAQLLDEKDRAADDLRDALERSERQADEIRREIEVHDRAMALVLGGGGMSELVEAATESLGGHVAIFASDGQPLAWTDGVDEERLHAMQASAGQSHSKSRRAERVGDVWLTGLVAGAQDLGTFAWRPPEGLADGMNGDLRLMERLAIVAALLMLMARNLALVESRVSGALLDDLLSPSRQVLATLQERAKQVGFDPAAGHVLLVAHASERFERLADAAISMARSRGGLTTTRDGCCVIVLPASEPERLAEQVAASLSLRMATPVTVGASDVTTDPSGFPDAYSEAHRCTTALLRLGRHGDSATARALGFAGLLLGGSTSVTELVGSTIGPLIELDRRRGSALLRTLDVYFATGQSPARSAQVLHVHPNTVTQRLDRVRAVLGPDWNSPEGRLEVQVALRLYRVATAESGASGRDRAADD